MNKGIGGDARELQDSLLTPEEITESNNRTASIGAAIENRAKTKLVDEYMKKLYSVDVTMDEDEGGYVISCTDLPGCLSSGETIELAIDNFEDAKRAWFEAAIEDGFDIH